MSQAAATTKETEPSKTQDSAVAKREEKPISPQQALQAFLGDPERKNQLSIAAAKHMNGDRIARVALTACLKNPKIAECMNSTVGKLSIWNALLTASQLGLEVDGRQAHLVPFNKRNKKTNTWDTIVQLIPGYQGLIDRAYNHPNVASISVEVVYEKDKFAWEKGLDPKLTHVPYDGEDDPGQLRATYAVCKLKNGGVVFRVLVKRDINRIRAFSKSAADADSIWNKHPAAMWMKSAIRELCKYIPQSAELRAVLDADDEAEVERPAIDITTVKVAAIGNPLEEQNLLTEGSGEPEAETADANS